MLAEVFTAAAWSTPYSFAQDSISSLGVTTCEVGSCSPMHDVMNSAFVALGVLTLLGALFLHRHIRSGRDKKWIFSLAAIIAVSTAATGLFPANDGTLIHWSAVLPGFVARHVVLVLIAWHMWHEKRLVALWSALCALAGLVGAGLMLGQALHFGLGERLALYPLPMWMAVTGMAVLMGLARRTVFRNVEFSLRAFHPRTATTRSRYRKPPDLPLSRRGSPLAISVTPPRPAATYHCSSVGAPARTEIPCSFLLKAERCCHRDRQARRPPSRRHIPFVENATSDIFSARGLSVVAGGCEAVTIE
ncbi:hypothetical protein W59_14986 [Rhodococcus opacus RKJ300 = JCM 13270]|uniref:DUF998 domain-containing protein n=1 Tax=Rhodococcus opacus RKJ300 = JCM 13270 TaxID=1165867 RepID=I0WRY1_RHOOP|nr:hypothetical protein W59_14986 [Rhodococcus opacus RKJ300 = JCM 13270]